MKYQANPVIVDAFVIVSAGEKDADGNTPLALDNGENVVATAGMTARYQPSGGDYWVVQEDGYIYVNPKDVFERKYSSVGSLEKQPGTFGWALKQLQNGSRVARSGWNGKGMWLSYSPGAKDLPADKFWSEANRDYAVARGGIADVLPCITMKTATGEILMGWLASQTDMLATDWGVTI